MGSIQNLTQQDAVNKMKELAEDISICMFCTKAFEFPFETRPMATSEVDDKGNFWFLSRRDSLKNEEVEENPDVQLIYAKPGSSEFMTVYGHANIVNDRSKIEELWNPVAKAWFKDGKDDPQLTAIRVRPEHAHYWDTKNGKMITLLKIATSVVSGKQMDGGVEGTLTI